MFCTSQIYFPTDKTSHFLSWISTAVQRKVHQRLCCSIHRLQKMIWFFFVVDPSSSHPSDLGWKKVFSCRKTWKKRLKQSSDLKQQWRWRRRRCWQRNKTNRVAARFVRIEPPPPPLVLPFNASWPSLCLSVTLSLSLFLSLSVSLSASLFLSTQIYRLRWILLLRNWWKYITSLYPLRNKSAFIIRSNLISN